MDASKDSPGAVSNTTQENARVCEASSFDGLNTDDKNAGNISKGLPKPDLRGCAKKLTKLMLYAGDDVEMARKDGQGAPDDEHAVDVDQGSWEVDMSLNTETMFSGKGK